MNVVVTGGLGYIGSHCSVELARAGHRLRIVDNLANAKPSVLGRIRELAPGAAIDFVQADLRDADAMERVFAGETTDAVLHFAGLKAVGESVAQPALYHDNNVGGAKVLLEAMARHGVERIVFSSSATVYSGSAPPPYTERHPLKPANPYGETKLVVERLLEERAAARASFRYATLRYFNPIGAHPSGEIGEDPHDIPNNLFPFICQVAGGKRERLSVFGNDWPTRDGTGVRDYLHVVDLAIGHLRAFEYAQRHPGFRPINLGTGRGVSVLQLVHAFEAATGRAVPYQVTPRRAGDIAECWAEPSLAAKLLHWRAERSIEQACADGWRWQQKNPNGYRVPTQ